MSETQDIWQVQIGEEIYQADFEEFTKWISEGQILPTDRVRKGNLRWIQAARVPALQAHFANASNAPRAPIAANLNEQTPRVFDEQSSAELFTLTHGDFARQTISIEHQYEREVAEGEFADNYVSNQSSPAQISSNSLSMPLPRANNDCYFHPNVTPKYVCRACHETFCAQCAKFVGTSKIALCPLCGELCNLCEKVKTKAAQREFQASGFGFADFKHAIAYPFKYPAELIITAIVCAVLPAAGIAGRMLAYLILFGCVSLVIRQVATGRLRRTFLPDSFDEIRGSGFIGIAISLVTYAPLLVMFAVLAYGVLGGGLGTLMSLNAGRAPQTVAPPPKPITKKDFDDLVNDRENAERRSEDLQRKIQDLNRDPVADEMLKKKQTPQINYLSLLDMLGVSGAKFIFIIVGFIFALAWAFFYYPMAVTIAGYTQDFWSVINPLLGISTMKDMGAVYLKAFLWYVCARILSFILGLMVAIITAPFSIEYFGNIPAKFIGSVLSFYFNLVIACLMGLALYKCADKLDIATE